MHYFKINLTLDVIDHQSSNTHHGWPWMPKHTLYFDHQHLVYSKFLVFTLIQDNATISFSKTYRSTNSVIHTHRNRVHGHLSGPHILWRVRPHLDFKILWISPLLDKKITPNFFLPQLHLCSLKHPSVPPSLAGLLGEGGGPPPHYEGWLYRSAAAKF